MGEALVLLDAANRIVEVNPAAEGLAGRSREALLGRRLPELVEVSHAVSERGGRGAGPSERAEQPLEQAGLLRRGDGSLLPVSWSRTPVVSGGTVTGARITLRARGTHVELEEWLRLEDALLAHLDDGVALTDPEGRILHWSHGAEALFGYAAEEVLGQPLTLVYPEPRVQAELARSLEGCESAGEWEGRRKDGRAVWVDVRTRLVRDAGGQPLGVRCVGRDVTARHEAEAARDAVLAREREERAAAERATERLRRLQSITAALSEALSVEQVAQVLMGHVYDVLRATLGALYVLDGNGRDYRLVAHRELPWRFVEQWSVMAPDAPLPLAAAVRAVEMLWFEDLEKLSEAFPRARQVMTGEPVKLHAVAAVPLRVGSRGVGIAVFGFAEPRHFEGEELEFGLTLLAHCAQALERARLYEAERQARSQAEHTLSQLDALLSASPVGFSLIDRELRFVRVNAALAAMNGYPAEAHVGRPTAELLPADMAEATNREVRQVLESGEPMLNIERSGETAAQLGQRRHWLLNRFPVRGASGEIVAVGSAILEITERKRAEEERERLLAELERERQWLNLVIERLPAGVMLVERTAEGVRLRLNRRKEEMLGRLLAAGAGPEQYVGQICDAAGKPLPGDELPSGRAMRGEASAGVELVIRRPDGSRIPVRASSAPLRDVAGRVVGAVTVSEDVSALKEFERLREEWTSVVAHDLRQQVLAISFAAQLAQRLGDDAREDRARELDRIRAAARQLDRMVEDLLDVSRIEARRLQLAPAEVDVTGLARETLARLSFLTEGFAVGVEERGERGPAWADAERIEQVLGNLVSNATRYGEPGTEIRIDVEGRADEVQVSVTNHGRGIPAHELKDLFTRFTRSAESRASRVSGLGLGLYICRGLVEAHGGRIWAESTPGNFTRFHFTLPRPPAR